LHAIQGALRNSNRADTVYQNLNARAAAELGDAALHSQLHPLTRDKAQMLGAPQLFKPTRYPFETLASRRQIHAGQRVYRLWPVFDPTADRKTKSDRYTAERGDRQQLLRNQIPEQYLNPMQFRYSREEVLYDMKGVFGTLPPESTALAYWLFIVPARLLKALCTSFRSRRRMKKWRAMLEGKGTDQQLWAVTPPRGFSHNSTVRRRAEEMLSQAGYDAHRMLPEWEIFWRRNGIA